MEQDKIEEYKRLVSVLKSVFGADEIVVAVMHEMGKDKRAQMFMNGNGHSNGNDAKATEKQLRFLKQLGVTPKAGLTKTEASSLIDEAQGGQ